MPLPRDVTWSREFMGSIQYRENTCREHGEEYTLRLWKVVSSSKYNWLRLDGYFCVSKPTNKVESFYFHGNVFGLSMNEEEEIPECQSSKREAIINLRILFFFALT